MSGPLRSIAIFCGSNAGTDPRYAEAARATGALLAERGISVVYGGGRVGLMGIVAEAVLAGGGQITGVIPQHLWDKEVGHAGLSELLIVDTMHERKLAMADRADAFVALPGGVGTLEELFEAITWTQLGIQSKPAAVLDVAGFYGPLLAFLDQMVDAGFLRGGHRDMVLAADDPEELLARLTTWQPVDVPKWLDLDQR